MKAGSVSKSLTANSTFAPNTRVIYVNFSSIHQKAKTQLFVSLSFLLWALAIIVQIAHNYGKENDNIYVWVIEILLASLFAAGFGWHVQKYVCLREMEKRGKCDSFIKEL